MSRTLLALALALAVHATAWAQIRQDAAEYIMGWCRVGRHSDPRDQIRLYTTCIDSREMVEAPRSRSDAYLLRGAAHATIGDLDAAIADYDAAIRLYGDRNNPYLYRGGAMLMKGDLDAAEADYEKAAKLKPEWTRFIALTGLAAVERERGDYKGELKAYRRAASMDDQNWIILNGLAWVLATSPDDRVRDGAEAVELAYAEAGRFEDAVREQTQAIAKLGTTAPAPTATAFAERLALYRSGKPYRDERRGAPG